MDIFFGYTTAFYSRLFEKQALVNTNKKYY